MHGRFWVAAHHCDQTGDSQKLVLGIMVGAGGKVIVGAVFGVL